MRRILFILSLVSILITQASAQEEPKRELRSVWVASVANIDWPKHPDDPWNKKQDDFIKILNFYSNLRFNAVLVQLRTAGDAFYPSKLAPWSRYLTGNEGDPGDLEGDLIATCSVHPMREDSVMELVRRTGGTMYEVNKMVKDGKLEISSYRGTRFYRRKFPDRYGS
mgnify:CR=1 FL=1